MNKLTQFLSVFLSLIILSFISACQPSGTESTREAGEGTRNSLNLSPEAMKNLGLELSKIGPGELRERIQLQGNVVLDDSHLALVSARLPGIVREMPVDIGQHVSRGEVLATLASQELAERIMDYVGSEWVFRGQMATIKRERALREREISSEEQLHAAEQAYHKAETEHSTTLQRLRVLGYTESDLHQYMDRPDLQNLTIYSIESPIDGRVLSRDLQLGAAIEPGTTLFQIADLRNLWVRFNLPLRYLGAVEEEMLVNVKNEVAEIEGEARIAVIQDLMDERSRSAAVRAELPNGEGFWRPGMPARIEIEGVPTPVERAVPLVALQTLEGQTVVFVETAPGKFSPEPVTTGLRDAAYAELLEGPVSGSVVATKNSFLLLNAWQGRE